MIYGRQTYDYQEGTLRLSRTRTGLRREGRRTAGASPKAGRFSSTPICCAARSWGATSATTPSSPTRCAKRSTSRSRSGARSSTACTTSATSCSTPSDRPQPHARREQHRDVPQLLRALLRPPVHHAQRRGGKGYSGALRTHARRLFPLRQTPDRRAAHRAVLRARSSTCRPTTSATWSNA